MENLAAEDIRFSLGLSELWTKTALVFLHETVISSDIPCVLAFGNWWLKMTMKLLLLTLHESPQGSLAARQARIPAQVVA